jgi:uncharacterized protein (DUF608 family)
MRFFNKTSQYNDSLQKYYVLDSWISLEEVHVLAQPYLLSHYYIHLLMLKKAVQEKNIKEVFGQIFRISLVLPGNIFMILPKNNPGTTRFSAFKSFE